MSHLQKKSTIEIFIKTTYFHVYKKNITKLQKLDKLFDEIKMGKLIEKYKSENPGFSFELNELVQQIKSENNEENKDLFQQ